MHQWSYRCNHGQRAFLIGINCFFLSHILHCIPACRRACVPGTIRLGASIAVHLHFQLLIDKRYIPRYIQHAWEISFADRVIL